MGSATEIVFILVLALLALLLGWATGALGWCLFLASLVWIGVHALEYRKARRWARRPLRRPENALESWFPLSYGPYRALVRERNRTRAMAARLRDLLNLAEHIPDGVIVLSPTGDIEGMNTAARELLSLTDADIGLGLATVLRIPAFVAHLRDPSNDEPLEFSPPFEPERSFEARRFLTAAGTTIVLIRDITTLNRLLTMRQNFVANVSHELRTPLTVITGYLETIGDEEQDDDLRLSLVERLDSPVNRMGRLVEDLMLLTQLESTPFSPASEPIALGRVLETAAQELAGMAAKPDQITVSTDPDARVRGIESELHSVCVNLLTNALRYSEEGAPIHANVTLSGDTVRLEVADNGFGIAPEHLDRLTERFYRVDLAGSRARGGTGLGLAIVKHILRRHESGLEIESTLGEGSTFYCEFASASGSNHDLGQNTTQRSNP